MGTGRLFSLGVVGLEEQLVRLQAFWLLAGKSAEMSQSEEGGLQLWQLLILHE